MPLDKEGLSIVEVLGTSLVGMVQRGKVLSTVGVPDPRPKAVGERPDGERPVLGRRDRHVEGRGPRLWEEGNPPVPEAFWPTALPLHLSPEDQEVQEAHVWLALKMASGEAVQATGLALGMPDRKSELAQ
eukprot:15189252-Alexandrium_andersonii.AAC.1